MQERGAEIEATTLYTFVNQRALAKCLRAEGAEEFVREHDDRVKFFERVRRGLTGRSRYA